MTTCISVRFRVRVRVRVRVRAGPFLRGVDDGLHFKVVWVQHILGVRPAEGLGVGRIRLQHILRAPGGRRDEGGERGERYEKGRHERGKY